MNVSETCLLVLPLPPPENLEKYFFSFSEFLFLFSLYFSCRGLVPCCSVYTVSCTMIALMYFFNHDNKLMLMTKYNSYLLMYK